MENEVQGIMAWVNTPIVHIGQTPVTLGGVGSAVLVFFGTLILSSFLQRLVSLRMSKHSKVTTGMIYALQKMLHYVVVFLGVLLAAQCVGLNLGSLAVMFGFLGVGIGFGLQNITSNFISGIIILLERPIENRDFVSVEGQIGSIVDINMRSTVINTLDNVTIVVPNSKFIEHNVINWSLRDPRVRLHCPVGVDYGSDEEKVRQVLMDVAREHPDVLDAPEPEVRFLEFGNSSLNFDLFVWIKEPKKQFSIRSEINYAIIKAFRKNAIRIPFPQQDLHLQMTPAVEMLARNKGE